MDHGRGEPTTSPAPVSEAEPPPRGRPYLIAIILGLFALQTLLASRQSSPAYDEVSLVPAGYVLLKTGEWHRLFPAHPPLIGALTALPLLALDSRLDLNDPYLAQDSPNPWNVGLNFLRLNNDDDRIFFWARLPILLLSLLVAYFVYRWAQELYGGNAGLMALLLYAFSPITVAFSGLASLDIGVSVFFTLSSYCLWRFVTEGTWHNLLWVGLLLGCALASKATAVVLPPIFAVLMVLAALWFPRTELAGAPARTVAGALAFPLAAETARARLGWSLGALGLIFSVALAVLYTIFLFPSDPLFYVRLVLRAPQLRSPDYPYYLMGHFWTGGWSHYSFLVAYVIKTPIPMLLLLGLALWHWRRHGGGWFREVFVLLPALALFAILSAFAHPIGLRYLLPAYPFLFIFVSRTAPLFSRSRIGVAVGIILAAWYLSTPLRVHPDYLAYFNELVGGPKHGIEYLDDSNIEWGQQLKRIKTYLDQHKLERVKMLYFTTGRPEYYGIRAEPMRLADLARPPEPGIYIVDANSLIRARAQYGVDWLKQYEVMDVIGYSVYVFRVG